MLQTQIIKDSEVAGIKIMIIIKQYPGRGITHILSNVLENMVFLTAIHSELHLFVCHS